jgi:hypothetical protein
MAQLVAREAARSSPTSPVAPRDQSPIPASTISVKASDIGYFWPGMPLKDTERDAEVIERDGKTYYGDVYAFTNRVRIAALTPSEAKIIRIIDTCLRGEVD